MKTLMVLASVLLCFSSNAQERWQVSVSGGIISPRFLIVSPLGSQVNGTIYYNFSETQLSISTGIKKWEVEYGPGGNKFSAVPVLGGARYLVTLDYYTWYFSGELGVHIINREFTEEVFDRTEIPVRLLSSERKKESVTKFAYRLGTGINIRPLDYLELEFGLTFNGVDYTFITNYLSDRYNSGISYYGFTAGVGFVF